MSYASYSTGFKSGGFQQGATRAIADTPFEPEQVSQVEVGLKSDIADRVRLNVSAFHLKYDDLQVNAVRFLNGGTTPTQLITNAAGASVTGVDLQLKAVLSDNFTVNVVDTYIPTAKIEGFSSLAGSANIEGFRVPRTSKNSVTASIDFNTTLGVDLDIKLGAAYAYRTRFVNELDATRRPDGSFATVPLPAYGLLNLTGSLTRGPWTLSAYVRNATDREYYVAGANAGGGANMPAISYGEPRTAELSLAYTF
jgi:iron complex outermembrane receptor protein